VSEGWEIGPFTVGGTILGADPALRFRCPVTGEDVAWAAKDVFNPAAVVLDGMVRLLVRAEDDVGPCAGTSRLGLATSADGVRFSMEESPVLFPDRDRWQELEWPGGIEDPRIVESPDGGFACLYSAFDGRRSRLMAATSDDLVHWEKHGPVFAGTDYGERWSKSGSVVTEVRHGRLVATRLDGRFHMYWGEGWCYGATSEDLVRWTPMEFDAYVDRILTMAPDGGGWEIHPQTGQPTLRPLLAPRPGRFDSLLVEPGPPAVVTGDGIVLVYNGGRLRRREDAGDGFAYSPGQVLFDGREPGSVLARSRAPMLVVAPEDLRGQVDQVCFAEGLVVFDRQWFLYFGMGDSRIGYAIAPFDPRAQATDGAPQ